MRWSHSRGSSAATATALTNSARRPQTNRSLLRFLNILRSVLACVRLGFRVGVIVRAFRLVRPTAGSRLTRYERGQEIATVHGSGELAVRDHEVRKLGLRHERGARLGRRRNDVNRATA